MQQSLETAAQKIKTLQEISLLLDEDRKNGVKIVQCHGVFDLLHPGHIRHFKAAKAQGDKLVVTVTPDRFVNKGPGRPAFTESLRLESLAALQDIDYVVLNDSPDAVSVIKKIKPAVYVKGSEYSDHGSDVTGKISEETKAVQSVGGDVHYTNDIVFSSSSLLNQYFDQMPQEVVRYIQMLKQQYSLEDLLEKINSLSDLKVLVVGDAIIDEYQFVESLGQSGKGQHMVVKSLQKEVFLGGSLIVANHIAQFSKNVTLLTALGEKCPYLGFIKQHLEATVDKEFVYVPESTSLVKKRYVLKDGKTLTKTFETYSGQEESLSSTNTNQIINYLKKMAPKFDLVLVCDFGNGFTNTQIIDALSDVPTFLALNTQTNSGNRGFNMITNHRRADYISLNEPELRLATHDKTSDLAALAEDISLIMSCKSISITRGVNGVLFYSDAGALEIPAFTTTSVDRIGAGDSYLALSALCAVKGYPPALSGFFGSIAAAISVQMIGNQEAIKKPSLCKFVTRLMK